MNLRTLAANLQGVRFTIHLPDGQILQPGQDGPVIDWYVHSERALRRILRRPQAELWASYLQGHWDIDTRHLPVLMLALEQATPTTGGSAAALRRLRERLPDLRHRDSAPPHWQDTNLWLSRICLGEELFQGCAHYCEPGISLEQAQRVRCRDLALRLQLGPGQHLLDISAGWGTLPLYLAEHTGVGVTALVATREQLQFAHGEARRRGLSAKVHFRLGGFQQCQGRYERILGSDLTGHHPRASLRGLIERLADLLTEDGLLWLQQTGRRDGAPDSLWHLQHSARRDALPLLSELHGAVEQARLRSLLQEDLSDYLLRDLHARARRFRHRRTAIRQRFGERYTRHWEYLIAGEIAAVESRRLSQYELVLGKSGCRWPAPGASGGAENRLPVEIARKIPGLARDI